MATEPQPRPPTSRRTRPRSPKRPSSSAARATTKPAAPARSTRPTTRSKPLFAPQYQTVNSPAHRAVWDRGVPVELFRSRAADDAARRAEGDGRLARSRPPASRRPARCSTTTARSPKRCSPSWARPATGACWSTSEYGGSGAPFAAFAPFLTRMATRRPDRRRPGLGPRLHRRGRSGAHLRQRRAESSGSCPAWPAASGSPRSR